MFSTDPLISNYSINQDLIELYEFIIAPIYIFFIIIFAYQYRSRYLRKSPLKKYFIPALWVKIAGGITICLIYNYYYKGGDTTVYYRDGKLLSSILVSDPINGIRLLFSSSENIPLDLFEYTQRFHYIGFDNTYLIVKISAIVQLFCFQSLLITSILFAFLSFWGIWKIFALFASFYPKLEKEFAISFLFLPSIFFWGSGILKDTVCLSSLCFLFCSVYSLLIERKSLIKNFLIIAITSYLLIQIKIYIIMSFSFCILVFVFLNYRNKLRSQSLKNFITPLFILAALGMGFALTKVVASYSQSGQYTFENLVLSAKSTRDWLAFTSKQGASYDLGEFDNSVTGYLKILPKAINATLFRPYVWEAHNFIALFAALENLYILYITVLTLFKTGLSRSLRIIISHDLIFFCLIFSLLFAFALGISNANFGALVRYKIPCIPFYVATIFLIRHIALVEKNEIRQRKIFQYNAIREGQQWNVT